jgi:dienelactone hydrolase
MRFCWILIGLLSCCSAHQASAQRSQAVTFVNDTLVLKGTLTLPAGDGPHPGVVLLHGSGPNDRNQEIVLNNTRSRCLYPALHGDTLENFRALAKFFQKKGLATLRYDKRTYTYQSSVALETITPEAFIRDGLAAVDYLAAQPQVASDQLILAGLSQGGNFLPVMAQERENIQGLIAMGTPARSIDTVLARQVRGMVSQCEDSTSAVLKYERILYAFEQLRSGEWAADRPLMNAYPPFWKNWLALTDTTVRAFQQVEEPTLFLNGSKDYNVPPANLKRFRRRVDRPGASFQVVEGMNHFLTPMHSGAIAPRLKKRLSTWLSNEGLTQPE